MNYTELVAAIKSYTENDYTTTDVNTFIQNAEQRIYNAVQIPDLRKNVTGKISSNNKYLEVPDDWLAAYSLAVINSSNEYTYLLNKDVNFIRQSFPDIDTAFNGTPQYYAIFDETKFILGPTPDTAYDAELHYYFYPDSIVTASTSWLGDNFDTALFYGSLLEAAAYLKENDEITNQYRERYAEAMEELKGLGEGKNRRDAYRSGQVRIPVARPQPRV
jgi:hypothetical protein|tara:strand:- start:4449 stop:5102 length:654 start_codon:yes stop_codon:yes gene_type:complete